jgi:hypothetical protein
MSNLKQWALGMYADDNRQCFPDNVGPGAMDLSWMAVTFTNLYNGYLRANHPGTLSSRRSDNDVLYCPTDKWVRWAEANMGATTLIAYMYLPGRSPGDAKNAPYNSHGLEGWITRTKFNGPYRRAPVMLDILEESAGNWTTTYAGLTVPASNHAGQRNIPTGGNILYEDGHVEWRKSVYAASVTKRGPQGVGHNYWHKSPLLPLSAAGHVSCGCNIRARFTTS